jgi:hypothetical protein
MQNRNARIVARSLEERATCGGGAELSYTTG